MRRSGAAAQPRPSGNDSEEVKHVLTVNPYMLAAVILMAISVGMQIGRLLTLWQVETKDGYNQRNQRND